MNPAKPIGKSSFYKQLMFGILLLLIVLPWIQQQFGIWPEKPLFGAFEKQQKVNRDSLNPESWFDGRFQSAVNQQTEAGIGFHNTLVRFYNQWQYMLFRKANAEGVIVGQQGELYEEDYLRAATGAFFIGDEVWKQKAIQLRAVQDSLRNLGKLLLVVVEPGKGTVYPEFFPAKYAGLTGGPNNYKAMLTHFEAAGVEVLDYNACFLHWKDTADYRLFPQTGTHWSYYGATLAADSLFKRLAVVFPDRIQPFGISQLREANELRHPDDDIWLTMNVMASPTVQNIAYPTLVYKTKPAKGLKLLTVGDSFYFNWQNEQIILNTFADSKFWYYNKLVYNHAGAETGLTSPDALLPEVMKHDVILIMITERFHQNFAWGFDTQLYEALYPGNIDRRSHFQNEVRIGNLEFIRIYNEALAARMPLQERLELEAKFRMFGDWQKHPDRYPDRDDVIEMLMMAIKGSPDWYAKVQQKASERGITDEEMLRIDAGWVYEQKQKERQAKPQI